MEQTHLISVCVFCLLCATHIHCSEYSSRTPKSKIKSKDENLNVDKFEKGPNAIGPGKRIRGFSAVGPYYSSFQTKAFEIISNHEEFLNSTQRSPESVNILKYRYRDGSDRNEKIATTMFDSGYVAKKSEAVHSVLSDTNGVDLSRNSIQTVNKYIKIPESVRVRKVTDLNENGDFENENGVRTLTNSRKVINRKRRSAENSTPVLDEQVYIENLFKKYRNSENRIDLNGFKTMLNHLGLNQFVVLERSSSSGAGDVGQEVPKDKKERINSLELRDDEIVERGGHHDSNHSSRHNKCISPGGLLRTIVRENLLSEGSSINVSSGEKRKEDRPKEHETLDGRKSKDDETTLNKDNLYLFKNGLLKLCPFLIYQLIEPESCHSVHHLEEELQEDNSLLTWLYATASVVIISLCGLLGVFVIPIMGHSFYQQLLQFLVALAVGTLCGDALLHLLPHAMIPHNDEAHAGESHDHDHTSTMWKGLAVLLGIVFFFFTEKCLTLASEWRKKHQRNKKVQGHSHVQILNGNNESESVGEKLCKHKYSSYPYCYPDIKSNKDGHEHSRKLVKETSNHNNVDEREIKSVLISKWHNDAKELGENQRLTDVPDIEQIGDEKQGDDQAMIKDDKPEENEVSCGRKDGEYTVIIREHESIHHGHSHAHGHVHSPPESLSSVAWMVILGDGLHNFTDGMAIGAAFANNIAGGFSTAVAVFCHELPHELGDFAVLIKAGMSAKQAVFYNLISSILCFFGMCLGIFVGDNPQATSWVFAVSAGMFLYIGLVDMFPELTSSHSAVESSFCQCSLQGLGLIAGVSIMLIIAFYEDQLLTLFN